MVPVDPKPPPSTSGLALRSGTLESHLTVSRRAAKLAAQSEHAGVVTGNVRWWRCGGLRRDRGDALAVKARTVSPRCSRLRGSGAYSLGDCICSWQQAA